MKRSINCAISMLLCFVMVLSVFAAIPGAAFAAETTSGAIISEDFETTNETGIPEGWGAFFDNGVNNNSGATNAFASAGSDKFYKISYDAARGDAAVYASLHHGIGKNFSIADKGNHTQVRITFKAWAKSNTNLLVRFHDVTDGVAATAFATNENLPISATTKPADAQSFVYPITKFAGTDIQLRLLQLRNQQTELYLDDILVDYVHTYDLNRDSGIVATGVSPAATYIKCDHCDKLKKDDPSQTGGYYKYTNLLLYEDFETPGANYLPGGWTSVQNANFSAMMMNKEQANGNNYYWFDGSQRTAAPNAGMQTTISLADKGGHTQVRISLDTYFAPGDPAAASYYNQIQTAFTVKDANGTALNTSNTGGSAISYIKNFDTSTNPTGTEVVWEPLSWVKNIAADAATATLSISHNRNSTAQLYIDNVVVEYAHTYELNRDSGIQASAGDCETPGSNYIKCDHCDALKKDDPNATGETTILTAGAGHATVLTPATSDNTAYYTCSTCGKYFSDEAGRNEIEKDSWIINGDSGNGDITGGGNGDVTGGGNDDTTGGTTGDSGEAEAPDNTGDSTGILLMVAVMAMSVCALAVVMTGKKRTA